MRAHRAKVRVSDDHELHVRLPSDFPPGEAEIILLESRESESGSGKKSIDELLATRIERPAGVAPVSLADMERAMAQGIIGRGSV